MNISWCQRGIYVFAGVIGSDVPWLDCPASRPHHNGDTFYITRKTMNNQCFMYGLQCNKINILGYFGWPWGFNNQTWTILH